MYKIQLGFEDGLYVAYLIHHSELLTEGVIEQEITHTDIDELIHDIPEDWKELLTSFMLN